MRSKSKVLLSIVPVASLSSIAVLSSINTNNSENKTNILTFHKLPEEFYNVVKNNQARRKISLAKNDLLLADYKTVWMYIDINKIGIYYDAGVENENKLFDNIGGANERAFDIQYSSKIDFNDRDSAKLKEAGMFFKRFDVSRKRFNYDLLRTKKLPYIIRRAYGGDLRRFHYEKEYVIREISYHNIMLSQNEAQNLLTSEIAVVPEIDYKRWYGWIGDFWTKNPYEEANKYGNPGNKIKVYFEERRFNKANFEEEVLNSLIAKIQSQIGEDEEILINETNLNKNYSMEIKSFVKNRPFIIKNGGENLNEIEAFLKGLTGDVVEEELEYRPNMTIKNFEYEKEKELVNFQQNYGAKFQIYAPDIEFVVINRKKEKATEITNNYEQAFNLAQNLIRNIGALDITNENISQRTLYSPENQVLLSNKIKEINEELKTYDFFIDYKIIEDNKIDLFLSNQTNSLIPQSYKLASNYPIKITPSINAVDKDVKERLIIKANKWVDFETNTTELVDDVPVLLEKQRAINDKSYYGGKWLYHSPASVDFTTINENEVLFINDKRIEVLDRHFSEILTDESNIVDAESKEEENKIKAYKIKILKFEENSGNVEEKLEYEYKIDILINSNAMSIDYKFYAWDPQNNADQRKLIEEYKKDSSGNVLKDENGRSIKNEFYDPEIDKTTGTKKQLVWVDLSSNTELLSNDNYTLASHLPYGTKTLLLKNGSQLIQGFIAEAAVLGSGALQILNGELTNSQYRLFKLNRQALSYNDAFEYEVIENNKKYKDLPVISSENSYFSDSGLYLFTSHAPSSIDNYKLVLIDKTLNAQKNKFVETINSLSRVKNFWESAIGIEFLNYLKVKHNIASDVAKKFSYELVMQYFVLFTNYVFKLQYYTQNSKKYISPYFNNVARVYSYETFKNKYTLGQNGRELFFSEYAGEFENKDLVKINSIDISSDKRNLIINLSLKYNANKNIFDYELSENRIILPISFIDNDVEENFAINVNFNLNKTIIENAFLDIEVQEWNNLSITYEWLSDISRENFNKAYWYFTTQKIDENNYRIDVSGVVKSEFQQEIRIVPKTKTMTINLAKKMVDLVRDDWEIRLKNSSINLAGINEEAKIKQFIERQTNKLLYDLAHYNEYELSNLEQIAPYLTNINLSSDVPLYYKILNIKRRRDNKVFKLAIYNFVEHKYDRQFDLSSIKSEKITLNTNLENEITKVIDKKLNEITSKFNLKREDLTLLNWEDVLHNLINSNKLTNLIVGSNHYQLVNTFTLKIQNDYKFNLVINNENDLNNRDLIDLSKLNIPALSLNDKRTFKQIQREIINYVSNFLASYNLFWNYDYYIEDINSPVFLIKLVQNLENNLEVKIKSLNKKSQGETSFNVVNILSSLLSEDEKRELEKEVNDFLGLKDNDNSNNSNGGGSSTNNGSSIGEKTKGKWNWDKPIENFINEENSTNLPDKDGINLLPEEDLSTIINADLVDLRTINIAPLSTYLDNSNDLAQAILTHINSNLEAKYTLNEYEFNRTLKQLLIPNKQNESNLIIRGLYGFSKGILHLKITNITSKNTVVADKININNNENIIKVIEEEHENQIKKAAKTRKIWIGVSFGILFLVSSISGFIVWVRRFKNKLK